MIKKEVNASLNRRQREISKSSNHMQKQAKQEGVQKQRKLEQEFENIYLMIDLVLMEVKLKHLDQDHSLDTNQKCSLKEKMEIKVHRDTI